MWRKKKRHMLTVSVSTTARNMTTETATRAFCGFPAPNSFETRVLDDNQACISIHKSRILVLRLGIIDNIVMDYLAAAPNPYGIVKCNVEIVRLVMKMN